MAKFFGPDIHQQILALGIFDFRPWIEYCIAAASSPFAPRIAQEHVAETGVGPSTRTVYISFLT